MGQNNRAPLGLASTTSRALPQENGEGFSFLRDAVPAVGLKYGLLLARRGRDAARDGEPHTQKSVLSPCPSKVKTTQGASGDTLSPKWPLIELHHDRVVVEFVEVGHE